MVVAGGEVGVTLLGNPDASSSLNDGTIDDDDDDDVDVRDEECVKKKKIRITRVLFVGDGDFSLSRAFAGTEKGKSAIIVATSLSSESDIEENWKGRENVLELRKMANVERVAHGIDATRVEDMMRALRGGNGGDDDDDDGGRRGAADAVVFAFPHLPGKGKISKNRELLRNFLLAARDEG